MIISIGTKNSTKRTAVETVLPHYELFSDAEPHFVSVPDFPTQIPGQPTTLGEIICGAKYRARESFLQVSHCDLGIGIEGGLVPLPGSNTGYEERTYCALYFLEEGFEKYSIGSTAGYEHPPSVIECVFRDRVDVSEAYKRCGLTASQKIGDDRGSVDLLTNGRIDRAMYMRDALVLAMSRLERPEFFRNH